MKIQEIDGDILDLKTNEGQKKIHLDYRTDKWLVYDDIDRCFVVTDGAMKQLKEMGFDENTSQKEFERMITLVMI